MNRTQTMCVAALASIVTINLIIRNYEGVSLACIGFASGYLMFRNI